MSRPPSSRPPSDRWSLRSATGNRFHLWNGLDGAVLDDPAGEARRLCAESGRDGLLLVLPGEPPASDARMVLHNADGGRAEMCGNGLRCVAALLVDAGVEPSRGQLRVASDVAIHAIEVERAPGGEVVRASADVGVVRECRDEVLAVRHGDASEEVHATLVDLGNPHCVVLGDGELLERLPELGARLERHERFPARTNVELALRDADGLVVRVWERGVGETGACGTGAAAAALTAVRRGLASWPVSVAMPGGVLEVRAAERASETRLIVAGPVGE